MDNFHNLLEDLEMSALIGRILPRAISAALRVAQSAANAFNPARHARPSGCAWLRAAKWRLLRKGLTAPLFCALAEVSGRGTPGFTDDACGASNKELDFKKARMPSRGVWG